MQEMDGTIDDLGWPLARIELGITTPGELHCTLTCHRQGQNGSGWLHRCGLHALH